jgi:hypothetical protein
MNLAPSVTLCAALLSIGTGALRAEGDALSATAAADWYGKYVWRGQAVNDHGVLQPSLSLGLHGFTGTVWGNLDLTDENGRCGNFTELDLSLDYTMPVPGLDVADVSVGVIHYRFPHTPLEATSELYVGASWARRGDESCALRRLGNLLAPFARVYYDVDEIDGAYAQVGIGHTFEKIATIHEDCTCDCVLALSLGYGSSGYNEGYFGADKSLFNDLTVSAGLPVAIKALTIRPSVNYATLLAHDIREDRAKNDNLWAGVSASYAF